MLSESLERRGGETSNLVLLHPYAYGLRHVGGIISATLLTFVFLPRSMSCGIGSVSPSQKYQPSDHVFHRRIRSGQSRSLDRPYHVAALLGAAIGSRRHVGMEDSDKPCHAQQNGKCPAVAAYQIAISREIVRSLTAD
jgi:hypothetical protein